MIWNFYYGFRWPFNFALLYHVFTYDCGFMPRALETSVLKLIFGRHVYSMKFMYILFIATYLLIMAFLIYFSYYFTIKTHNSVGSLLILWWSMENYGAYMCNTMGYLEQDGFVIVCIVLLLSNRIKSNLKFSVLSASMIAVSVLISETNAFLTCPVLIAMAVLRILEPLDDKPFSAMEKAERRAVIKDLTIFLSMGMPSALYCLYSAVVKVPQEQIERAMDYIRSYTTIFDQLERPYNLELMGQCFYKGRLSYTHTVNFAVWEWQLKGFLCLMAILVVVALLYAGYRRKAFWYGVMCVFAAISCYAVSFIAADWSRFKASAALMITFLGIWMLRRIGSEKIKLNKEIIYLMVFGTVLMFMTMDFNLIIYDESQYNTSFAVFSEQFKNSWHINY